MHSYVAPNHDTVYIYIYIPYESLSQSRRADRLVAVQRPPAARPVQAVTCVRRAGRVLCPRHCVGARDAPPATGGAGGGRGRQRSQSRGRPAVL